MNRIIIIGTFHLGLTPKNDLLKILEDIKPDQLLVEFPQEESARVHASQHSDEMDFAVTWAATKTIPVDYFDADVSILRNGISEENPEYQQLVNEQVEEIKAFSWQTLNKKEPWQEGRLASIERTLFRKFFDPQKWTDREEQMLENIKKIKSTQGTVLILTGAGHLDFFERELSEAEFPFRW
jgi:pheromone shutdown protein TraB